MNSKQIKKCLILHSKWLAGEKGGVRANLSGTNLSHADLHRANLFNADLSRADLSGANLSEANLSRADLSGANLYGTHLFGIQLSNANLRGTLLEEKVILSFQFERDTAYFYGTNEIKIACESKTVREWVKRFVEVGKKNGYTEKQIEMYGNFIKQCAKILKDQKGKK